MRRTTRFRKYLGRYPFLFFGIVATTVSPFLPWFSHIICECVGLVSFSIHTIFIDSITGQSGIPPPLPGVKLVEIESRSDATIPIRWLGAAEKFVHPAVQYEMWDMAELIARRQSTERVSSVRIYYMVVKTIAIALLNSLRELVAIALHRL